MRQVTRLKMCQDDIFKECFSFYKKKKPPPNLEKVIDFDLDKKFDFVCGVKDKYLKSVPEDCNCRHCNHLGLIHHSKWKLYSVKHLEGFLLIRNPFTPEGQRALIRKSLEVYPTKPSITNLDKFHPDANDIWKQQNDPDPVKKNFIHKLCWATLGYNYNWDTKKYNRSQFSHFPICLQDLSEHIAHQLGFNTFKAEAAIINYYNLKSRLSIHKDESEEDLGQPLISCSLGQTGIFLVGTESRDDRPTAMFLRSGDIVIMSGASRLSYHAVPQIILEKGVKYRYGDVGEDDWVPFQEYIDRSRINISMRQVFKHEP